jgi:hypothetical protein
MFFKTHISKVYPEFITFMRFVEMFLNSVRNGQMGLGFFGVAQWSCQGNHIGDSVGIHACDDNAHLVKVTPTAIQLACLPKLYGKCAQFIPAL